MCGIAGWISNKPLESRIARDLAQALLFYAEERGDQSAGIWRERNGLLKKAENAFDFIESKAFDAYWVKNNSKVCLLHTRQPTCGGRGDEQAQPFITGDSATIHNGWYTNAIVLKNLYGLTKSSTVDSQLVSELVETYGVHKLPEFLSEAHGASAIAAYAKGKLFLIRDTNPLCFTTLKFNNGLKIAIFASTPKILTCAIRNIWLIQDLLVTDVKPGKLWQLLPTGAIGTGHKIPRKSSARYSFDMSKRTWEKELTFQGHDEPSDDDIEAMFREMRAEGWNN